MTLSRKRLSTLSALIGAGLMAVVMTIAQAEETEQAEEPRAKGAKERRAERYAKLIESFEGDRRAIYAQYGFPSFRYRERDSRGVRTTWVYVSEDLTFVFEGDRLVRDY